MPPCRAKEGILKRNCGNKPKIKDNMVRSHLKNNALRECPASPTERPTTKLRKLHLFKASHIYKQIPCYNCLDGVTNNCLNGGTNNCLDGGTNNCLDGGNNNCLDGGTKIFLEEDEFGACPASLSVQLH